MRFLMLNWRDPINPKAGGAERVSQAFLSGLIRRGHEVFWFANAFQGCSPFDEVEGIKIVRGGGQGTSVYKAWAWFRTQPRFDLVIDQHHGIPWYAPWWSGTRCIAYLHEVLGPIWNAFYSWPLNVVGQWQERWTHRLYARVPFWVPSHSTAQALERHGVRQVVVIPNGVDTKPLAELEAKELQSPLRLIAVSRLAPNKRVHHAIQAAKLLLDRGIPVELTIVGRGEAEPYLRETVVATGTMNAVRFTGSLTEEEKNAELRRAHLLVHASIREGWGLNVIEANAMGTPAVVYPVHGLVDSTLNGETGLVTDTETPRALADSIVSLLKTPGEYTRLRNRAWERSKTFQWDEVLPPACAWLEDQASGKRPGSS